MQAANEEQPTPEYEGIVEGNPIFALVKYDITEAEIAAAKERYAAITFDTPKGYEEGRLAIAHVRDTRVAVEKRRQELKVDALAYGRKVDRIAQNFTNMLREIEEPLKAKKKAVDDERERIKREAEEAKQRELEEKLRLQREAEEAKARAIREAEEERLRKERERLEAVAAEQRAAQARIDEERSKLEAERAEREAAEARARAEREAEEARKRADEEAARRAEIERQEAALAAERERMAAEQAERERVAREERERQEAAAAAERAEIDRQRRELELEKGRLARDKNAAQLVQAITVSASLDELAEVHGKRADDPLWTDEQVKAIEAAYEARYSVLEAEQAERERIATEERKAHEQERLEAMRPDIEKIRAFGDEILALLERAPRVDGVEARVHLLSVCPTIKNAAHALVGFGQPAGAE